jgi:hypothetical protein
MEAIYGNFPRQKGGERIKTRNATASLPPLLAIAPQTVSGAHCYCPFVCQWVEALKFVLGRSNLLEHWGALVILCNDRLDLLVLKRILAAQVTTLPAAEVFHVACKCDRTHVGLKLQSNQLYCCTHRDPLRVTGQREFVVNFLLLLRRQLTKHELHHRKQQDPARIVRVGDIASRTVNPLRQDLTSGVSAETNLRHLASNMTERIHACAATDPSKRVGLLKVLGEAGDRQRASGLAAGAAGGAEDSAVSDPDNPARGWEEELVDALVRRTDAGGEDGSKLWAVDEEGDEDRDRVKLQVRTLGDGWNANGLVMLIGKLIVVAFERFEMEDKRPGSSCWSSTWKSRLRQTVRI